MSRTWTAATPVRVSRGDDCIYIKTRVASLTLSGRNYARLTRGEPVRHGVSTWQLIPEAVAMADDLPLENGR